MHIVYIPVYLIVWMYSDLCIPVYLIVWMNGGRRWWGDIAFWQACVFDCGGDEWRHAVYLIDVWMYSDLCIPVI